MNLRSTKKLNNEISLDESIGTDKEGNNLTFADILPADNSDIVDSLVTKMNAKRLYQAIDAVLNKAEKDIIIQRYGLFDTKRLTQREVAEKMGISRSYVSRIEKRALKKLAEEFNRNS